MKMKKLAQCVFVGIVSCGAAAWGIDGFVDMQDIVQQFPFPEDVHVFSSSNAPVLHGRGAEMREALSRILAPQYCAEAVMEGMTSAAAVRGEIPIEGFGCVRLDEEDWPVVLLEMANEEFTRHSKEGTLNSAAASDQLSSMVALLGKAPGDGTPILEFIAKLASQSPPELRSLFFSYACGAWINLTIEKQGAEKCLELSRILEEAHGRRSWPRWIFLDNLGAYDAFARCPAEDDLAMLARYVMESADLCQDAGRARTIDVLASGEAYFHEDPMDPYAFGPPMMGVPGWKGSLQRKRLAERFRDVPAVGRVLGSYNVDTGEMVPEVLVEPTQQDIDRMIWARAAKELATDDAELTDLREVYGDWSREDARD